MNTENNYFILAFYCFTPIENPSEEVAKHQVFFATRDIRSRIYISEEGINGQMSGAVEDARAYMDWLHSDPRFQAVEFKIHTYHEHVFPRATVKTRAQIVALDAEVDVAQTGTHVPPEEWKKMLEERDENTLLLDVRNDYEWEIGRFEGAELPELETFRAFPKYAKELKEHRDPKKTKVMMYCTGGIRCELYSALLKKEGFENIFQLHGGVIKYGLEEGSTHWKGKLYVFDDRMAVPIVEGEETLPISSCRHCEAPSDVYYNCANMDCNELFLACPACAEQLAGCCCAECQAAPRRRAFDPAARPKPFRRKHLD